MHYEEAKYSGIIELDFEISVWLQCVFYNFWEGTISRYEWTGLEMIDRCAH